MKRLFSRMPKKVLTALAVVVAIFGVSAAVQAWYPDRPTYTIENPADHVTFNSITNNPNEGDERAFFEMKDAANTQANGFSHTMADLKDGQEVLMRVYVHNNAATSLNTVPDGNGGYKGVAKNAKVRIFLPTATAASLKANAYISADNAQPQEVSDTINLGSNSAFSVEYVPGSAMAYTNAVPTGMKMSDSIVTTGAPLGYDKLDGKVPGCFQYTSIVTIKVKIKKPVYKITKQVRFAGQTAKDWKKSVVSKPGDKLEWSITFTNAGSTQLKNVKIVDNVPAGLTVVPNTVVLYNGNYPNGYTFPNSAVQANGRQINTDIGSYNPLSKTAIDSGNVSAQMIFATTVDELPENSEDCTLQLTNKAFATPEGYGSIYETADVTVKSDNCKPKKPVYACDLLELKQLGGRKVEANVKYTAENGATFKDVTFDFGDGSTPLVTTNKSAEYTFAKDGTYTVKATVRFNVDDTTKSATSESCAQPVTFTSGKPVPPTTPPVLPNTGAGDVIALFSAVTIAGAIAHRVFMVRRLSDV